MLLETVMVLVEGGVVVALVLVMIVITWRYWEWWR